MCAREARLTANRTTAEVLLDMPSDAMGRSEDSMETTGSSGDGTPDVSSTIKQEASKSFEESQQAPQAEPQFVLTWPIQSSDESAKQNESMEDGGYLGCQDDGVASAVNEPDPLNSLTEEAFPLDMYPHILRRSRNDASLVLLTRKFLNMLTQSKDGILDLNLVSQELNSSKRRVYDVTNVLEGINLIRKIYKNHVQWLGGLLNKDAIKTMNELAEKEKKLDDLIESCTEEIHRICVDEQTSKFSYVTYEDIQTIPIFREQTVLVVKGPEDTTLDVAHPSESFQFHLKSTRGPIDMLICSDEPLPMEVASDDVDSDTESNHTSTNATNDSYTSLVRMPLKNKPSF
ncbi:transcription factor E2F3 [Vanacampus margaritifer]